MKTYIGIDPGASGFVAVMPQGGEKSFFAVKGATLADIVGFLRPLKSQGEVFCCIEDVHAVFGSSAGATFAFGHICGVLEGVLAALAIPYQKVPPKTWQNAVWTHDDKVFVSRERKVKGEIKTVSTVDPKKTSLKAAARLFPDVDFRRSAKCRDADDNKCDAMLICEYGRRMNL